MSDKRTPAAELLKQFLEEKDLVLIVSEATPAEEVIPGRMFVVSKKPLVQVAYKDDFDKAQNPGVEVANGK